MEILGALLSGVFIGSVLGFVGAGGAMLSVPILIYLFDFTAPTATTAALAIVIAAATSGLIPKFKSKARFNKLITKTVDIEGKANICS